MKSLENNFDHPEVNSLLTKHFIELRSVSPEGSAHVLDIPGLKISSIKFWSLWDNNQLIGCGALKFLSDTHGEFKSIRVADKHRKKGMGEKIISHLITEAKKIGIKKLSIETGAGEFFLPARKLFKKFGFKACKPFAHYKEDPNSCYFDLEI
jgi:N-acetylglutamate synthase and related acetyltransferases